MLMSLWSWKGYLKTPKVELKTNGYYQIISSLYMQKQSILKHLFIVEITQTYNSHL